METNRLNEAIDALATRQADLEQQNSEASFVYCFGGNYFHIPADIMDVYTLLFYEGKYIKVGNAYSEELPKKIDDAQIKAYNERP